MWFFFVIIFFISEFNIKDIKALKNYFKEIPVEISSETIEIRKNIYGAKQAYNLLKEKRFEILKLKEMPLGNLPGKLKLFLMECKKDNKTFKVFVTFKFYKKKWIIISFKEAP